ncbi:FAD-binding and (Fe-S)-binding domain-containing protein [Herbaspirillum sp. RV1423]|uniref:D-2-hydroxyglutarate dehydrogenase YdiJ n=1 Tax=Herbaspirillum sp. RV1423 TaxID=1443993 RepID=UPI0004B9BB07|nr:FAD-binding and (Fe-S)-binding domain-containing protein [Herbaspirillum sp. RV1423]
MIPRLHDNAAPATLYLSFLAELAALGFEGECSHGAADRVVLATDNSIYQVTPQAVVFPAHHADVVRVMRLLALARFRDIKLSPRGGGTGTNGQSLTDGLVVDLSRHMNRILEIDVERRLVRVQTGVVKDQLDRALARHGLFFPPELSTSNRATIGGMISTDASGQGSCLYGKTRDYVVQLHTVLADGTPWRSQPLEETQLEEIKRRTDRVGSVHRLLDDICSSQKELIAKIFPRLNRCLTGYDLAHIRDSAGRFDLNSILCGSEGTLGLITEATLKVLPLPACSALVTVQYDSFDAALRDAQALMAYGPASIETIDATVLQLARNDIGWEDLKDMFPASSTGVSAGVNLIEFVGDEAAVLRAQVQNVMRDITTTSQDRSATAVAWEPQQIERVWAMRKRAVGLLGNLAGEQRPIPFVEDTAVPPEHLADYIAEFRAVLDRSGVRYGMFGHVDAGVLHVRPALDMKDPVHVAMVREVTDAVVALTRKYHGLLWGEHGKGMRSEFSPQFFGALYPSLQSIKLSFDPYNQINPGKLAAPAGEALMTIDGTPMRGQRDRLIPPIVRADYEKAMHCNGNGACYNFDVDDAMCPSWKSTRERRHSPKGRATLLREWLRQLAGSGAQPLEERELLQRQSPWQALLAWPSRLVNTLRRSPDFSHEVKEAMNGCLSCKSCAGQCPVKVDIPKLRAKFLLLYYGRYLRPLRDHVVALLEELLPSMARFPRLINALMHQGPGPALLRRIGLVATPRLAELGLGAELSRRGIPIVSLERLEALTSSERHHTVIVVQDAFTSHYETILPDLLDLLRVCGVAPMVAPFRPNGKALHVHGMLGRYARTAKKNAAMLNAFAATGVALVGLDPAMTLSYRQEYAELLGSDGAPPVLLVQEWLARHLEGIPRATKNAPRRSHYLPHCTERTTAPAAMRDWQTVFAHCGLELVTLASGCCGMAGTWGHEAEHRAQSEHIYSLSWAHHVMNAQREDITLLADGFSCRCQAAKIDRVALLHPVQWLLACLTPPCGE